MFIYSIYEQLAELIACLDPLKVQELKDNEELHARLEDLVDKSKEQELDKREKDELNHYIVLERLFRFAKIRAQSK